MFDAARQGDAAKVKKALQDGAFVNAIFSEEYAKMNRAPAPKL